MFSFWQILLLISIGAGLVLLGVVAGGWLMFKGKAAPGEGFLSTPKGEVFSITDPDNPEYPEETPAEKNVLGRAASFMSMFSGGKP
jgi:hypothetical protein